MAKLILLEIDEFVELEELSAIGFFFTTIGKKIEILK
jgi:hypothetical protein